MGWLLTLVSGVFSLLASALPTGTLFSLPSLTSIEAGLQAPVVLANNFVDMALLLPLVGTLVPAVVAFMVLQVLTYTWSVVSTLLDML